MEMKNLEKTLRRFVIRRTAIGLTSVDEFCRAFCAVTATPFSDENRVSIKSALADANLLEGGNVARRLI